jgi:hypothetical protein
MSVFPNPAHSTISIATPENQSMDLEIYSITGKLMHRKDEYSSRTNLEINTFASGSYVAVLTGFDGTRYQKKFVKK